MKKQKSVGFPTSAKALHLFSKTKF
ncbi:hypothetical protein Anas_14684 [Armadillidium nasatum]|uniref:Uncharacterized protein n=1 Tax=Armadillidium nasatum TaxID=96803 RepID=A0A5N5T8Q2_9CRUS|nr:hypothetical protein Anas_14684 [Armadillidium nasatum]